MNQLVWIIFETLFFYSIKEKAHKRAALFLCSLAPLHLSHFLLCLPPSPLSFSPLSTYRSPDPHPFPSSHSVSHVCVPVLYILTVSVSHLSPQLWRTAGSSWWISLTTNCGCLCPMCHSPMRDAMCASSTRILLKKPTQTSLSWVGVRISCVKIT